MTPMILNHQRLNPRLVTRAAALLVSGLLLAASNLVAQPVPAARDDAARDVPATSGTRPSSNAHEAFEAGQYDQAAAEFSRRTERRPKDAAAQFNLGSALHQLEDYDGAKVAFEQAIGSQEKSLRAKAAYDLGNTAYRQGLLDEAITRYTEALTLDPNDEDAKHNLEFVQEELKRRQEQAEQRQQDQKNQEKSDQEESESGEQDSGNGENQQQDSEQDQSQDDQQSQDQKDSDGDGLSDQQERDAENPTNPNRADSDGDGRSDGEEDQNRNGRVDEGESNPNRPDPAPSGETEQESQQPDQPEGEAQDQEGQQAQPVNLSPEQAERLLAALQDQRPPSSRKQPKDAKKTKSTKDW